MAIRTLRLPAQLLALLSVAALGCGGDDTSPIPDVSIRVAGHLPGPVSFDWDGGSASSLVVRSCGDGCAGLTCEDSTASGDPSCSSASCQPDTTWLMSFGANAAITPPVAYGEFGGAPDPQARPLMAGVLHAVSIERRVTCGADETCDLRIVMQGCATFTP